jgi:hypothetical protein
LLISQILQANVLNLQHAHWARCYQLPLLMLHFKLLDEQRTWVTTSLKPPSEEALSLISPSLGSDDASKEWTCQEVLFGGLKSLNPRQGGKLGSYPYFPFQHCINYFSFSIFTFLHSHNQFLLHIYFITPILEKKKNIIALHPKNAKPHMDNSMACNNL